MEKIIHADPEEICKKILAANEKITQVEYCPITVPEGRGMAFIFRIGGNRHGGTILGGQLPEHEEMRVNQFILMAKHT